MTKRSKSFSNKKNINLNINHLLFTKINYPKKSDSVSCREQIKTLARVTSSCSRLVDSIFTTHNHEADTVTKAGIKKNPSTKVEKKVRK